MYQVALTGVKAPDLLTLGTRTLRRGESVPVSYLTSDMLDAWRSQWVTITPEPPVVELTATLIQDESGAPIMGSVIPPIATVDDAAAAVSTLIDGQNRIVQDLSRMAAIVANLQTNIYHLQSIVDRTK